MEKNVGNIICAEMPPPDDPLHELVMKMIFHRSCGLGMNSRLSCVQDGACKRGSPKLYSDATLTTENSFPDHRRKSLKNGFLQL